jgi:hypothetical protein
MGQTQRAADFRPPAFFGTKGKADCGMKSLLAKLAIRKFVGLYLGEHEVSASMIAVTPLGPVQTASVTEPCPPNELLNVIERVLQSMQGGKRRRLQVAIGLPNSRVFFGTRPVRAAEATPEAMMQKLLCSANVSTDDLTIDMIKGDVEKTPTATVGACRKKYLAAVLGVLQQYRAQVVRTEPAPCALVRAAARKHRTPRRAKTLLRIFLGAEEGLAVLTVAGLPLAWRSFAMPSFSEGMTILSAARTLLSQSRYYEMSTPLDYAIVHGRADLHDRLQKEGLPTEIGVRMVWHDGPALGGEAIAYGLAVGCLNQNAPAFDLSKTMKPRPLLRDIFPWGDLAWGGVLMGLMALALAHHSEKLDSAYLSVQAQCEGNKVLTASANMTKLSQEKTELTKKLDSLHKFLDSRIMWTNHLRGISNCLPNNVELTEWQGDSPLGGGKAAAGPKTLRLGAKAPLLANGTVPPEVRKFLNTLRNQPLLQRDFSRAEITGIRPIEAKGNKPGRVDFTIVCQATGGKASGKGGSK